MIEGVTEAGMLPRRWIALLAALLLVAGGGLARWAYTHGGYPNTVYYRQGIVTFGGSSAPPFQWQIWDDPRARATVQVYSPIACATSWRVLRAACAGGRPQPSSGSASPYWQPLQRGGYAGVGDAWLRLRRGAIHTASLAGRPALRFTMRWAGEHLEAWIDATTHVPLQVRWTVDAGLVLQRWLDTRTLAPGALPADFFDRPRSRSSRWDQAIGWLRDRLGGE